MSRSKVCNDTICSTTNNIIFVFLVHLGCAKIATLIKGKSPEEIKNILADDVEESEDENGQNGQHGNDGMDQSAANGDLEETSNIDAGGGDGVLIGEMERQLSGPPGLVRRVSSSIIEMTSE